MGERLSCRIVVAVLKDRVRFASFRRRDAFADPARCSSQGVDAELVSLENIVESAADDDETRGADGQRQLGQPFYDRLSKRLGERLLECENRVPVITGESAEAPRSTDLTLTTLLPRQASSVSCPALC